MLLAPISRRRAIIAGTGMFIGVTKAERDRVPSLADVPALAGYVGDFYPFAEAQTLPPFKFRDVAGRTYAIADLIGRVLLLNFWATWCAPCVYEMPGLDRLQAGFSENDFLVVALNEDRERPEAIENFLRARGLRHLGLFIDPAENAMHACAVPAMPTSFMIDRAGRARGILPGAAPWDSAAGRALVAYYVAGN